MTATKNTALQEYCAAHYEAICLLGRLTVLVGDMPAPEPEAINWGHVGSLRHVIAMLTEVETHLEGATQCPAN